VVTSLRKVNRYLNSLEYSYNDFNINLLTNAYEDNIKSLESSLGYDKRVKHLNIIFEKLTNSVEFSTKIDVKSNLKFQVLQDICIKFNLNINSFKEHKRDLEKLIQVRNSIAHGESAYSFEKYEDIQKYITLLSKLMNILHIEIDDFFRNEKYKK